jgi:hypothetical protein
MTTADVVFMHVAYIYRMVVEPRDRREVHDAFFIIVQWFTKNDFKIAKNKAVKIVFRKRGRLSINEHLTRRNESLDIVKSFKNLGIRFQTLKTAVGLHLNMRLIAASCGTHDIRNVDLLLLEIIISM